MKPCVFHPEADDEFASAIAEYAQQSAGLGERFYDEIFLLAQEIALRPGRFRPWRHGTRRHFRRTFPYAVVFVKRPDRILILTVAHFKRRPDYWRTRIR